MLITYTRNYKYTMLNSILNPLNRPKTLYKQEPLNIRALKIRANCSTTTVYIIIIIIATVIRSTKLTIDNYASEYTTNNIISYIAKPKHVYYRAECQDLFHVS
jgi:hypothetical protein